MKKIQVSCPAKINLTLEIVNKRDDGFHNIKSIMQTINLYDKLDIGAELNESTKISLSGTSSEIPYNENNLVYKAADLFLKKTNINASVNINIKKNIPVSAGLAGGSTDAAGTLEGLNELFEKPLTQNEVNDLCAALGSDLNVCLEGGTILATSRGEKIKKIQTDINYPVTLIKPKHLGISAREAYTKYANIKNKTPNNMTECMLEAINTEKKIEQFLYNDLEYAVFDDYKELQSIKKAIPDAVMSGSGSTFFVLREVENIPLNEEFQIIRGLHFIPNGIKCNNFVIN